jgi:hypothetical protein
VRPHRLSRRLTAAAAVSVAAATLAAPVMAGEPSIAHTGRSAAAAVPAGAPGSPADATSVADPYGGLSWARVPAEEKPAAPTGPRASRSAARTKLPRALVRPAAVAAQPLPTEVLTRALAPAASLPRLARSCHYNPRIQQLPALDAHQMANARTIVAVAQLLQLPPRAAVIALATAYQESWLRNLNWGDRDSLGLFQQRPSFGWGTPKQILSPAYAAAAFYAPLVQLPNWQRLPVTVAAQSVQRSAFPHRYARWELMAATIVDQLLDVPNRELSCTH